MSWFSGILCLPIHALTVVCKGRKEMFYLMTHSSRFIYGYMASDMVKDNSGSARKPAAATTQATPSY